MPFQPLAGFRVLDLTNSLAGPYCTQILAALGAEVVKVEHPQRGDETRQWGPPFVDGEGAIFLAANAGKRSLALNFHDDAGKKVLYRLADRADVVVQSLRPGHAEKIGFGAGGAARAQPEARLRLDRRLRQRRAEPRQGRIRPAHAGRAAGIISVTGEADRSGRARRRVDDRPDDGDVGRDRDPGGAVGARPDRGGARGRRFPVRVDARPRSPTTSSATSARARSPGGTGRPSRSSRRTRPSRRATGR